MWTIVVFNLVTTEVKVLGPFCCEACGTAASEEYIKKYDGDTTPLHLTVTEMDDRYASEY